MLVVLLFKPLVRKLLLSSRNQILSKDFKNIISTTHIVFHLNTIGFEQSLNILPDLSICQKRADGLFFLIVVQRAVSKDYAMPLMFVKELRLEPVLPR